MGYDSRIYVVEKSYMKLDDESKQYASVIAIFEGCKFPALRDAFYKETDCYIYADDGNTKILEDRYGDTLKEASVQEVISAIEEDQKNSEYYRRVPPLLGLLRGFDPKEWRNIAVLHYGH